MSACMGSESLQIIKVKDYFLTTPIQEKIYWNPLVATKNDEMLPNFHISPHKYAIVSICSTDSLPASSTCTSA